MVCVPCFIIPVLLFIWHRFIQPYVLRWWNPWQKKDEHGNPIQEDGDGYKLVCEGGVCSLRKKPATVQDKPNDEKCDKGKAKAE